MKAAPLVGSCALLLLACTAPPDDEPSVRAGTPSRAAVAPLPVVAAPITDAGPSGQEVETLYKQLAQLQRDVSELRQQLARSSGQVPPAERPADPRVDPEARAQVERERQLRAASLASTFGREPYDPRWSQANTANVRAALTELDESIRDQVLSVECRSQSCRVEIASDAAGPLGQGLPMMLGRLVSTLPNATAAQVDRGDGVSATVLYLSR